MKGIDLFTKKSICVALSVAAVLLSFFIESAAVADETPNLREREFREITLVVMGDSYSAGNGAGGYMYDPKEASGEKADKAYRSRESWGYRYGSWLAEQGVSTRLKVLAHSGNTTKELLSDQVKDIPSDTDLVMLTIGGNDIGFGQVAEKCLAEFRRTPEGCKQAIENAREIIRDPGAEGLKARTKEVF